MTGSTCFFFFFFFEREKEKEVEVEFFSRSLFLLCLIRLFRFYPFWCFFHASKTCSRSCSPRTGPEASQPGVI